MASNKLTDESAPDLRPTSITDETITKLRSLLRQSEADVEKYKRERDATRNENHFLREELARAKRIAAKAEVSRKRAEKLLKVHRIDVDAPLPAEDAPTAEEG